MEMSNALQKNLMQLFPNKIIYSAELCKNISVHMALHREAKRAGVSSRQLTESNGFVWKDIERAMDFSGEKVDESLEVVPVINQIYTTQTFLGNAILTEEQRIAVYSYAKSAFDKRFVEGKGLSITEEKAIILETIFALQGRSADDDESQSKIWVFVFKHFCGYTLGQGTTEYQRYYRFFCKAIDEVMRLTNHFLVPTEKNGIRYQGYYDTLLIHALEPANAANRFFSILFDFYVNTLDCQYIPGDPAFKPLVKAIKAKWNDNFDSEVDVRSAVVSASFKTLLELCQGYACVFCEDIIHKMDVITSGYGIDGIYYEDGQWHYTSGLLMPHGGPYRQARTASATLRRLVKDHTNPAVASMVNHIKFVSAVWFPDMAQDRVNRIPFGSDANKKITLCYDDLVDPRPAIERIMAIEISIGNSYIENRMTDADLNLLVNNVICPKFHLIKMPSVERGLVEMQFNMLLKEQYKILDFLDEQPTAVINGAAGTGKTMVAVEKARRHSVQGDSVLFLCFNRMLRDHLNQQYKSGLLKKDFENVDFMTISALAYKVAGDMNGLEDLEQWLSDCYDKKEVFGYKHVIVDEGQDFGLLGVDDSANEDSSYGCQIIDILELVALGNGGTFYLFCDRNQIVQGAGADAQLPACISDSECKLTLHRNCRNTYEIATTSIKPLPKNDRNITAKQGPKSGIKPHMYAIANSDEQIEYINKAIDSLKDTCESITILSVKNTLNNSILSPYTECESVGDYSRHYTHKGKECLFSNCSKFKGLEADAIILIDVDSSTFDKGAMYFYVGASRARRNLEIISNATKEDCALMVRSLNPKAPLRRDPISMLKVLLSCDVDLIE